MKPDDTLGARVRQLRVQHGLTMAELSERVGCASRGQIGRIESGIRNANQLTIRQLAKALDVTESFLIYGRDDPALLPESTCADVFRIQGRPKGRTSVQMYPTTAEEIRRLAKKYCITTPELLEQIVEFATAHMGV